MYRLIKKDFSFDKLGMTFSKYTVDDALLMVKAVDLVEENKHLLSSNEIEFILSYGKKHKWNYSLGSVEKIDVRYLFLENQKLKQDIAKLKEQLNIKPYSITDLKPLDWVFDNDIKACVQVLDVLPRNLIAIKHNGISIRVTYRDDRFYPVQMANLGWGD